MILNVGCGTILPFHASNQWKKHHNHSLFLSISNVAICLKFFIFWHLFYFSQISTVINTHPKSDPMCPIGHTDQCHDTDWTAYSVKHCKKCWVRSTNAAITRLGAAFHFKCTWIPNGLACVCTASECVTEFVAQVFAFCVYDYVSSIVLKA